MNPKIWQVNAHEHMNHMCEPSVRKSLNHVKPQCFLPLTHSEVPAGRRASPRLASQPPAAAVPRRRHSASSSPAARLPPPGRRDAELPREQLESSSSRGTTDRAACWLKELRD